MKLTHDASLTGDLAEIIGYLRVKPYESIARRVEEAVRGSAEDFIARLADHLDFEEKVLFPALVSEAPDKADRLERLKEDHELLRIYARDLACRIASRDDAGAYAVTRSILVALLEHVHQETRVTEAMLDSLAPEAQARVKAVLEGVPDDEGPDLVDPPCGT